MKIYLGIVLGLMLAASSAIAHAARSLDGWGQFKFGMTLAQAQRVAPVPLEWLGRTRYDFSTMIDGQKYKANLYFNGKYRTLSSVILMGFPEKTSSRSCRDIFQNISERLSGLYGSPVRKEHQTEDFKRYERFSFPNGGFIEVTVDDTACSTMVYYFDAAPVPKNGF
jgi:hypothetical protein